LRGGHDHRPDPPDRNRTRQVCTQRRQLANQIELGPPLSDSDQLLLTGPVGHLFGALVKLNGALAGKMEEIEELVLAG